MNYDEHDRDEANEETFAKRDRLLGINLGLGIQPPTDLLSDVIELSITDPPPSESIAPSPAATDYAGNSEADGGETANTHDDESSVPECYIDTRIRDDSFIVVADLPGAIKEDLAVGINQRTNELIIRRDGTVVETLSIPWEAPEVTRIWFNNGILEIHLSRPVRKQWGF